MQLELVREEELHRPLPGGKPRSRFEASGVALENDTTALVVFDNLNVIARVDLSPKRKRTNRLLPAPSLGLGFEDITIEQRDGRFIRCTPLPTQLDDANKGFEGLAHAQRGKRKLLYALHVDVTPRQTAGKKRAGAKP